MDERKDAVYPHQLVMENRSIVRLTGVTDVKCFDEQAVELATSSGDLTVVGSGLHISVLQLETGDLHLTGTVDMIQYREQLTRRGKLGRLFR